MIRPLFENNLRWAASRVRADPEYFRKSAGRNTPEYLWIGCAESRVPAHEVLGLEPGAVLVHRNVANLAPPQDANFLSVLQFAVEVVGVRRIIVCGHYDCRGVRTALEDERRGFVDHWLQPIRSMCLREAESLDAISDMDARVSVVCERNVVEQVANLAANPIVQDAWRRGRPLSIHGWIYSSQDGLLRDLEATVESARAAPLLTPPAPKPRPGAGRPVARCAKRK